LENPSKSYYICRSASINPAVFKAAYLLTSPFAGTLAAGVCRRCADSGGRCPRGRAPEQSAPPVKGCECRTQPPERSSCLRPWQSTAIHGGTHRGALGLSGLLGF
jgi:hypothetical protein